jgi:hypothetical protein
MEGFYIQVSDFSATMAPLFMLHLWNLHNSCQRPTYANQFLNLTGLKYALRKIVNSENEKGLQSVIFATIS